MKMRYLAFASAGIIFTFLLCLMYENSGIIYYTQGSSNTDIRKQRNEGLFVYSSPEDMIVSYTYISTTDIPSRDEELTHFLQKLQKQIKTMAANSSRDVMATTNYKMTSSSNHLKPGYSTEQKERINRIITVCKDTDIFRDLIYKGKNNTRYYFSKTYGFSYCKVPKSGSTFWTQAFYILENGVANSETVFSKARSRVHGLMGKFRVNFNSQQRKRSLSVIVSRDPFSRLYSAFIDKSFLFLNINLNREIMQLRSPWKRSYCLDDVTFQEFLDFIILKVGMGQTLNRHWAPIYNLCRPCDVNAYILVKQDSFSKDVEQALKAFSVPDEKLDTILSALHEHRIETTIPGIVQTVMNRNKITKNGTCVYGQKLIQRIWTAFKIQGYLKEKIEFPSKLFNSKLQYYDTSYVTEVILASINRNKMTSSEMKRQRHRALVDAYSENRYETLEQIIEIYKLDFKIFNYSTIIPHD